MTSRWADWSETLYTCSRGKALKLHIRVTPSDVWKWIIVGPQHHQFLKVSLFSWFGRWGPEILYILGNKQAFVNPTAVPKRKLNYVWRSGLLIVVRYRLRSDFGPWIWESEKKITFLYSGHWNLVPWLSRCERVKHAGLKVGVLFGSGL
jgi:hypothetical protein